MSGVSRTLAEIAQDEFLLPQGQGNESILETLLPRGSAGIDRERIIIFLTNPEVPFRDRQTLAEAICIYLASSNNHACVASVARFVVENREPREVPSFPSDGPADLAHIIARVFRIPRLNDKTDAEIMDELLPPNQDVSARQLQVITFLVNSKIPPAERLLVARAIVRHRSEDTHHRTTYRVAEQQILLYGPTES